MAEEPIGKAQGKEKKEKSEETTTVLVGETKTEKKERKFPGRLILVYVLLLAAGLFIGIVFRLAVR